MPSDRVRRRYRAEVGLLLRSPAGDELAADFETLDGRRISTRLARPIAGNFPVGSALTVGLADEPQGARAVAVLVGRDEADDHVAYDLVLNDRTEMIEALLTRLRSRSDRRETYRLPRDPVAPLTATVRMPDEGLTVIAPVLDVSVEGCAVLVAEEVERRLADVEHVDLILNLPSDEDDTSSPGGVAFEAEIRHRRLEGTHVRYGLSFLTPRSAASRRQRSSVLAYIMDRQRVMLRARLDGEEDGQ